MYREFFQFDEMPFASTADPRFFFKTAEHDEALAALLYGVTQRRGLIVVTGPPGTGKTLLSQLLVKTLDTQIALATIKNAPQSGHDLLTSLCREFGVRHHVSHPDGELLERLQIYLTSQFHGNRCVVAVIDEAQNMSVDLLEHLRMLGNLEKDASKLLQIVLLGQPELFDTLQHPSLGQLRQRIFCSCELKPLDRDQTRNYIRHRLAVAGAKTFSVINNEAIDLIHDKSAGLPRMINQITDNALLAAYSGSREIVDRQVVANAIGDMMRVQLQQPQSQSQAPAAPPMQSPYNPCQHVATQPGLSQSAQAGSEVAGRLAEISQRARAQADEMSLLMQQARQTIERTLAGQDDLSRTVRGAESTRGDLEALVHKIENNKENLARVVERVADGAALAESVVAQSRQHAEKLQALIDNATQLKIQQERDRQDVRAIEARGDRLIAQLDKKFEQADRQTSALDEATRRARQAASALTQERELADASAEKLRTLRHEMDQAYADATSTAGRSVRALKILSDPNQQLVVPERRSAGFRAGAG